MNTTTTPANVIFESYSMDYTTRIHHAMSADGRWFTRSQGRHPVYGYRWSAWRSTVAPSGGFNTGRKARLPKQAQEVA